MSQRFPAENCYGIATTVYIREAQYERGGGLAVQIVDAADDMDYATASINVKDAKLAKDEFVMKTYSENEGLMDSMLEAGVIEWTERFAEVSGDLAPICRLLPPVG